MLKNDVNTCASFHNYLPCYNFIHYNTLEYCLKYIFKSFPIHSTKKHHILYRYNESKKFSCSCGT